MKSSSGSYIKLGVFVTAGTLFLIMSLYLIGNKRNIFGNTIRISASFYNVNGLMAGNNVRYAGIDIGTVDEIVIENDSSVTVYMIIQKGLSKHVKQNAMAGIGTDGLMGNKLVNINPGTGPAPPISEGDLLLSLRPIENDEMVRTLNTTNENLAAITDDLRRFTSRLNRDKGLLKLLEDSMSAMYIEEAIESFKMAAENTEAMTYNLRVISQKLNSGSGLAAMLLNDTVTANNLKYTMQDMRIVADTLTQVTSNLNSFTETLNDSDGLLYTLSSDSALANDFRQTVANVRVSTELLNEDLKALQKSMLMKKYFKEKEKEERKKNKQKP